MKLKLSYSTKLIEYSIFGLTLSSLTFLAIYVHAIYLFNSQISPELFFWISAATFSISIMLLWAFNGNKKTALISVFISALVIVSIPYLRFYFYGADLVGEYSVADFTRELGRWAPERISGSSIYLDWHFYQKPDEFLHRYFSSISVTILPAIISEVTCLSTRVVLWILLSLVSTATVMVGFLIIKICFNQKIATLSSIVLVFSSFYIGKFATILREDVALFFLLLATFYILKKERKDLVVSLISLMFLPMSHYGLVYFAILFLLLLLISEKVYENKILTKILRKLVPNPLIEFDGHSTISRNLVIYSAVIGFSWLLFVAYPIFIHNLMGFIESLKTLLCLKQARLSYFQHYVIFSSLGPFHTAVQWLERILAVLGVILSLKNYKSRRAFSVIFTGTGMLAMVLVFAFLPVMSLLFDLDRMMQLALLGFSFFIATAILFIFQKNIFGKFLSIFFVTLILLEALQIPILYSPISNLSRENYVFSFTHSYTFYEFSDFKFAEWVKSFTSESAVFASDNRGCCLCLIAKRICIEPRGANVSDTISLLESGKTDYLLILSYLPDYMSFISENGDELQFNSTEVAKLLDSNHLNRIYDNSRAIMFGYIS